MTKNSIFIDDVQYKFIVGKLMDISKKLNVKTEALTINPSICFECGATEDIHQHHVIPQSKGGKNTIPLCIDCHKLVHEDITMTKKFLIQRGIDIAKRNGKYMGRKDGATESIENFMNKQKVKDIIQLLNEGNIGIRKISKIVNCSPNYIYKVKDKIDCLMNKVD